MEEKSELFSFDSSSNFLKKNILIILLVLGGVVMLVVSSLQFFTHTKDSEIKFETSENQAVVKNIYVDISGAVNSPGVYEFSPESRISDGIKKAGGFSKDANTEFVSQNLNQAQVMSDGMKIYIPILGEETSVLGSSDVDSGGLINLNTASESQLDSLPGIGPSRAGDIISGRPYTSVEELVTKKIVGSTIYNEIKDLVTAP